MCGTVLVLVSMRGCNSTNLMKSTQHSVCALVRGVLMRAVGQRSTCRPERCAGHPGGSEAGDQAGRGSAGPSGTAK